MVESTETYYFGTYSPVGDIIVIATCIVFLVLMHIAYISKSDAFTLFRAVVITLFGAAFFSVAFHYGLLHLYRVPRWVIYFTHAVYHILLYLDLVLYIAYMQIPLRLDRAAKIHIIYPAYIAFGLFSLYEILAIFFKFGIQIIDGNKVIEGFNFFPFGYVFFVILIVYMLIAYRKRVYRQVINGILGSCIIAFLMLLIQERLSQSSYTVASFLFPTFAVLYMIHSNPFDLEMGAVDALAFESLLSYAHKKGREQLLMSLLLPEMDKDGAVYPEEIKDQIRYFAGSYFRGATMFQVTNGRLVLVVDTLRNASYEHITNSMLNAFAKVQPQYGMDFKIVIMKTMDRMGKDRDYVGLIKYVESTMEVNQVHFLENDDVQEYLKHKYILTQLEDICRKNDLEDPRVEVFCQPVLNIETRKYDTAEALMRIMLPETGRAFPDVFIPLAENHGLIHQLSLIILNKTCRKIRSMIDEGYHIQRISVNISAQELRDDNFCPDINRVIRESGIPFGKVAIELTESQSESDFMIMKNKIEELKGYGIKFYLDDFGTGYSNFERIMELPFDIIKFDRSLVLATAADEKSEKMVSHLAKMFSDMNYAVLYEGVETITDEEKCIHMNAKYLQGYKYSRPIPMDQLTEYFDKVAQ